MKNVVVFVLKNGENIQLTDDIFNYKTKVTLHSFQIKIKTIIH